MDWDRWIEIDWWIDWLMDGWMDGWRDGWMDGWIDGCMHGCMHACMHGIMNGRTDRLVGGWMVAWMYGWIDGWMNGWMDDWMNGWIGWVVRWVGGFWTGGRTDRPILLFDFCVKMFINAPVKLFCCLYLVNFFVNHDCVFISYAVFYLDERRFLFWFIHSLRVVLYHLFRSATTQRGEYLGSNEGGRLLSPYNE